MPASGYTVFIVEDDPSVRDALGLLLGLGGHAVAIFADAESFLRAYRPEWAGCMLIDIRMPGISGLELQERLAELGSRLPVIIMTGHGDVDSARRAFRAAAVDFLEKPLDQARLLAAIGEAFEQQSRVEEDEGDRADVAKRFDCLTPREFEVMRLVVSGKHNRDIALDLGISVRTVEVHKARMMTKLGATSIAELVRLSMALPPATLRE